MDDADRVKPMRQSSSDSLGRKNSERITGWLLENDASFTGLSHVRAGGWPASGGCDPCENDFMGDVDVQPWGNVDAM